MDTSTIEKPTPDQIKEMCWQYLQKASEAYQKENAKLAKRLAKEGITPDEFVAYCRSKEPKPVTP